MTNPKKIGASIGGIIILILAIIAFAVAPMTETASGSGPTVLGKWGSRTIDNSSDSPFIEEYEFLDRYIDKQRLAPGDDQRRELFLQQLAYIAFRSAVIRVAAEEEVKNAGYTPPDFRVNKELVNYYLDEDKSYSELRYAQTSESQKLQNIKQVEKSLLNTRYIEDLFGNGTSYGLKTSGKESAFIAEMVKNERSFKYVAFNAGMYPSSETVKYGKEHSELFTEYDFSLLNYESEEEAEKMLASIKSGEVTFDSAVVLNPAKTLTDDAGKLKSAFRTDINRYIPDNDQLKAVLELKPSETSPVVTLNNGMFGIIRCDGEPKAPDFESEVLVSRISDYINTNEKGMIDAYLLQLAEKFSEKAKTEGFEQAAENFGEAKLSVETSNFFGINYGNAGLLQPLPNQGPFRTITRNEDFFKKAFALKSGEVSEPLSAGYETVVLALSEEKEADQYTLDSTKKTYGEQAGAWIPYNFAMVMSMQGLNYPVPVGQKTFIDDYVFSNSKFTNNFDRIIK